MDSSAVPVSPSGSRRSRSRFLGIFLSWLVLIVFAGSVFTDLGCNPNLPLDDPLSPKSDIEMSQITPAILSPVQFQGKLRFPEPSLSLRIRNAVGVNLTGFAVSYTRAVDGTPLGLPLHSGGLNIFVRGGTFTQILSIDPTSETTTTRPGTQSVATFQLDIISRELEEFLRGPDGILGNDDDSRILVNADITIFGRDINGHFRSVEGTLTIGTQPSVSQQAGGATAGGAAGGAAAGGAGGGAATGGNNAGAGAAGGAQGAAGGQNNAGSAQNGAGAAGPAEGQGSGGGTGNTAPAATG